MLPESLTSKILTAEKAAEFAKEMQSHGKKVVFTNGCFDILHAGHVVYLDKSRSLGDALIVGINSDQSVQRQGKSKSRPLQNETSRSLVMASLACVNAVVIFDEDTPLNIINTIMPDILVKGADYSVENIVGAKEVLDAGGEVKTVEFLPGYSTTAIENKILADHR